MEKKLVNKRIEIQENFEKNFGTAIKEISQKDICDNIGYFENISLSIEGKICDILENRLLSIVKNKNTIEILKEILSQSDIFMMYQDIMDNNLYLHIVKEIAIAYKDIDLEKEISDYLADYYDGMSDEEISDYDSDYNPQLEIQLDLNIADSASKKYPISKYDLIYADPITFIGDRFTDEGINPIDSIMLYMLL